MLTRGLNCRPSTYSAIWSKRPEIDGHLWHDLPFVLQIIAVEPSGRSARIGDRKWLVAGLDPVRVDRQGVRIGRGRRAFSLDVKAAAQGVDIGNPVAAVALDAVRDALSGRGLCNTVEQQIAE